MNTHTPWHKLVVHEVDNFRFRVESEAKSGSYMVDAIEGVCDCPDFQIRIAPILSGKKAAPSNVDFLPACKHLLRAKLWVAEKIIETIRKETGYRQYDGP